MIEKITVENLKIIVTDCDYWIEDYDSQLISEKQIILDSSNKLSIHNEKDFPGIGLLDRMVHRRYYDEKLFGVSKSSEGYGYIDIEFTQDSFCDNRFRYVQQYMDSVPYFETLAYRNSIVAVNQEGSLFSEAYSRNEVGMSTETIIARYYLLNSHTDC